jgi:putative flippase GtrA
MRPNGRNQLGLKIAFVVFAFAGGFGSFAYALVLLKRGEDGAVPLYGYAGALGIGVGLLVGFLLNRGL